MQVTWQDSFEQRTAEFRYLETAVPLVFPESAEVPESDVHLRLRTALYLLLHGVLEPGATVGSDLFIYYDAGDPSKCVAPDAYVRLSPREDFPRSWKVWERGAPEVAVEIVSELDASEASWQQKLGHYRHLGVRELLRFDPQTARLRIWDRVAGVLVEREVASAHSPSSVLAVGWAIASLDGVGTALRIATGNPPTLVPTADERADSEAERATSEAERAASEAERATRATKRADAEAEARRSAEARVRELEAELARRR